MTAAMMEKTEFCRKKHLKRFENCRSQMRCGIKMKYKVLQMNKFYANYIREKVYEQLINANTSKKMLLK